MKRNQRRPATRIPAIFPVAVKWAGRQFRWLAREFSEYGVLLGASRKELVGESLKLELQLSTGIPPLEIDGIVAYGTTTGLGVRFKNMSPGNRTSLKEYLERYADRAAARSTDPPQQ